MALANNYQRVEQFCSISENFTFIPSKQHGGIAFAARTGYDGKG